MKNQKHLIKSKKLTSIFFKKIYKTINNLTKIKKVAKYFEKSCKFVKNSKKVELSNYLKTLLYNHNKVIIPGLGALITHYKAAEINSSEKIISPPIKYLSFDPSITQPDNLLANHIANIKKCSQNDAQAEVRKIVTDFFQKLNKEETVLLEGIGYFSKEDNIIRFEKEQDSNYLTESFGLSKIDYEPIELELISHIPPIFIQKPRKNYTIPIIVFIILFLAGGTYYIYRSFPDLINYFQAKDQIKPTSDTLIYTTKDTINQVDTSVKKSDIEDFFESTTDKKNALAIAIQEEKKSTAVTEKMNYYIIAGSFKTIQKAEILAREIEKDGYKTKIIKFENFGYRITLGEYTDFDVAIQELEKIRTAKGDNTVWLLKEPIKK